MMKHLTLLAGALMLVACSNDDAPTGNELQHPGDAIEFDMADGGTATRAFGEIYDETVLQTKKIGVFASYTGKLKYENTTAGTDYMWNQMVAYASTAWNYAPVKYWPNSPDEYVSFFAYGPYEEDPQDDGRAIIDISDNDVAGDPWLNFRMPADPWRTVTPANTKDDQIDLVFGLNDVHGDLSVCQPWTDVLRQNLSGKVKFTFKHALACIGNTVTIALSQEMAALINGYSEIQIEGIEIEYKNLTNKARLVLNSADGSANWKEIISGELTTDRTYTNNFAPTNYIIFTGAASDVSTPTEIAYLNNGSTGNAGDGLFYIPLQVAGTEAATAAVTVKYRVHILATDTYLPAAGDDAATASTSFTLSLDMEGKKQGIALTLSKDFSLMHLVYTLGGTATEPSYARRNH